MSGNDQTWWASIRKGLTSDPEATHYKAMGKALWLYIHLHQVKDLKTEIVSRKVETLSKEMGIPRRTIQHWLKTLQDEEYIKISRGRASLKIQIIKNPGKTNGARNGASRSKKGAVRAKNGASDAQGMAHLIPENGNGNGQKIKGKSTNGARNGASIKTPLIKTPFKTYTRNPQEQDSGSSLLEIESAFEEDWRTYPSTAGKGQAKKKYVSSVGKNLSENRPKFQKAMRNYLSFVDHERNNGFPNRRHKDGSTFFNQWEGWVDYKPPSEEEALVEETEEERQAKAKASKKKYNQEISNLKVVPQ